MLYLWIILQIILESLPVSSSGHVALMQRFFGKDVFCNDSIWIIDFLLHGPMIIILIFFFFKTWFDIIFSDSFDNFTLQDKSAKEKNKLKYDLFYLFKIIKDRKILISVLNISIFVAIADGITICFWFFDSMPKISLTCGFIITALLLYSTKYIKGLNDDFDAKDYFYAICLGIIQSISFLPGISRFGSTYAIGRFCGYSGKMSFAVSFLIQFPLLVAAFIKGIVAMKQYNDFMMIFFDLTTLFVILTSSIISYYLLLCVDRIIKRDNLWKFSWYMLIPIMLSLIV